MRQVWRLNTRVKSVILPVEHWLTTVVEREYLNLHGTFFSCFKFFLSFCSSRQWVWVRSDSSLWSLEVLLQTDETDDPPDDAEELNEMMEFGRRDDFMSGKVPANELRNFGAGLNWKLVSWIITWESFTYFIKTLDEEKHKSKV